MTEDAKVQVELQSDAPSKMQWATAGFVVSLIANTITLGVLATVVGDTQKSAEQTHVLVEKINAATGPEAQAQNEATIKRLVCQIDANNRIQLEVAVNELAKQGIIKPIDLEDLECGK